MHIDNYVSQNANLFPHNYVFDQNRVFRAVFVLKLHRYRCIVNLLFFRALSLIQFKTRGTLYVSQVKKEIKKQIMK